MRAKHLARASVFASTLFLLVSCGGGGSASPGTVTDFLGVYAPAPRRVVLNWTNPPDGGLAGVLLARSVGAPVAGTPVGGTAYVPGDTLPGGGDVVFAGPGTTHTDAVPRTGLYHYAAFCYTGSNDYGGPATCETLVLQAFVYMADQDTDTIAELYLGDVGTAGTTQKLNAPLRAGSLLETVAGDDQQLVYLTDHDTAGLGEIYRATYTTPGSVTKLNGAFLAGTAVVRVVLSQTGTHAAYVADADNLLTDELYLVDLGLPGVAAKVNTALPLGADVEDEVSFSPDGTQLCYVADELLAGVKELFVAEVAPLGAPVKMNAGLTPGGDVTEASISPDGVHVFYIADQQTDNVFELFRTDMSFPTLSAKVNGALVLGGDVHDFVLSPDGQWIVYSADQTVLGQRELWLRPADLSVPAVRLNGALANPAMQVRDPIFHVGSSSVLYRSDEVSVGQTETFLVATSTPGAPVKLNSFLVPGGDVHRATFNAACDRVVWVADAHIDTVDEVFVTNTAAPGTSTRLNGPLLAGGGVTGAYSTFDGEYVLYTARQDSGIVAEAYAAPLDGSGPAVKLNPPLVAGGDVEVAYPLPFRHLQRQVD